MDWLQPLSGAHPGIWRQQRVRNFQRPGLYGKNSTVGTVWCQWKRLWSQGHKTSEEEQVEGCFRPLSLSDFGMLKDRSRMAQKVLGRLCFVPSINDVASCSEIQVITLLERWLPHCGYLGLTSIFLIRFQPLSWLFFREKSLCGESRQLPLGFG